MKVLPRTDLARRSDALRASGGRLVLTNGCFDLLHVGHVRYLQAARQLGDALAVAINSDASVRRLKGMGRPIHSADDRAEVIAALEAVNWVVIFGEDTAAELVGEIEPDVYVKGGDYSFDPNSPRFPPEGHVARAHGGEVQIIEFVDGKSTTAVVEKLLRENSR